MRKHVIRALVVLQLLFNTSYSAIAQIQGAISAGAMQYEGDIGGRFPKSQLNNPTSKPVPSIGMELGYKISPVLTLRTGLTFGTIYGDDTKISQSSFNTPDGTKAKRNFDRALQIKSHINEIAVGAEMYPLFLINKSFVSPLQPYLVVGFGVFNFNPKGVYTDTTNGIKSWVALKPLRTEGQGIPINSTDPTQGLINEEYSLYSTNISIGLGLKYAIKSNIHIGYELLIRRTNTDYLDDASKNYIDVNYFDQFFSSNPILKDQAKQFSNRRIYYNNNLVLVGNANAFDVGEPRGGLQDNRNDFYYTNSIKLIFDLSRNDENGSSRNSYRRGLKCPSVF
jgi:hypothetical protein